jgi:hypothetical protein
MITSKRMRWARHVALMGEMRNTYSIFDGQREGKKQLGNLDVDGRIILKWILGKSGCVDWINVVEDGDRWRPL